jgi:di/tricarboxylate transporter
MILPIAIAVSESLSKLLTKGERGTLMRAKHSQSLTIQMKTNEDLQMELTTGPEEHLDGHLVNKNRTELENGQNAVDSSQLSKVLQLSVAYGANIGGLATLIGSHPNFIFRMTVERCVLNFFPNTEGALAKLTFFLLNNWFRFALLWLQRRWKPHVSVFSDYMEERQD